MPPTEVSPTTVPSQTVSTQTEFIQDGGQGNSTYQSLDTSDHTYVNDPGEQTYTTLGIQNLSESHPEHGDPNPTIDVTDNGRTYLVEDIDVGEYIQTSGPTTNLAYESLDHLDIRDTETDHGPGVLYTGLTSHSN